ncbi:unnamed protein product [Schistosoma margrebowiei]|uniref:Egg protein CP391S-like protein n=1 Tax=Schistosoma margrebowiei TaxID=48269 RepID=A0AA85AIB0_9TREM|nr:unnamed protein product [Schistosoma margrebowiei]
MIVYLNHFRYTLSSGQFILVCSVIFLVLKFIDCHEICTKFEFEDYKKVIFENNSHEYSHHYYYSRVIRFNQPPPVISDNFEKLDISRNVVPEFVIKFYGNDITSLSINRQGLITIKKGRFDGNIFNILIGDTQKNFQISNGNLTFKVTTMINSNGKISFYYENVTKAIRIKDVGSGFSSEIQCGKAGEDEKNPEIRVHRKWIRSGTLVEFEALGDCSKYNSSEACQDPTTLNTTCIWCETANMCITNNDESIREFKVNGCKGEVSNW